MTMQTKQIKALIRSGQYAFPGGYPMFFVTNDGEVLSFDSVKANWKQVCNATRNHLSDGWRVIGADINWEDSNMYCVDSGKRIESAYAED